MPRRMVNSLRKGPKGGEPVTARKAGQKERCRRAAGRRSAPRTSAELLAGEGAVDVAGGEEQAPLGQGVVDQMQQGAEGGQPADADADGEDPHVLDAGIGEHPLDVGLAHHEDRGEQQREEPQAEQRLAGQWPDRRRRP